MEDTPLQIDTTNTQQANRAARPAWLKVRAPGGPNYIRLARLVRDQGLHTVCEEANCPNMGECWEHGTATFMILGDTCTRSCGFCAVKTGRPPFLDTDEPRRVAEAIAGMNVQHAVLTSVNRDELPDGGAAIWAETITRIREASSETGIEVLIPDFQGDWDALRAVMDAKPDILNHNIETVPRLYRRVRPQAKYARSIELLRVAKEMDPNAVTKTGMMLGLGEVESDIEPVLRDLAETKVDILTLGQYLRPTMKHLPVDRYVTPEEFARWKETGEAMGLRHVESGPLVRSSYHAWSQVRELRK
ncbi:MAG: lipoyl synthase [Armatimonadetes bacterium]|jgi:lipoic acid synthetase|nr:lipoyl synthase [Armatimonadota bacterium]